MSTAINEDKLNAFLGKVVGDFGAALMHKHASQTTQITAIGSPAYMSPEQIRLETVNHQTDIYSLGVTMYRLLTGRLPFQASTQAALTYAILNTLPASPAKLRPEIPPLVDGIVMKAMAKDPKARYASWLEFGKDLSQAFTTLRLAGASVTDSEKFNRLRQMEFFAQFGDVALWEAVRIGAWRTLAPGTVIIREGEGGDSFYVLVEGELDVTLRGMRLATIRPGGCFGEISCFTERVRQRTTTITAPREVTAIEIKGDGLRASTHACQAAFTKAVMRVVIDRLLEQNERLTVSVAEARVPPLKKAQ